MNPESHDQDVRDLFDRAFAHEEPSPELLRRLRTKTMESKRKSWRPRLAVVATGIAVLAIATFTLAPTQATAKTFEKIVAAADQVNAFQFRIHSRDNGKTEDVVITGREGEFAIKASEGAIVKFSGGAMKVYDPDEKQIVTFKVGDAKDMAKIAGEMHKGISEGLHEMDLKKLLRDYEQKYGKDHIKISPVGFDGTYTVVLEAPQEPERITMRVNAANDLPESLKVEEKDRSGRTNEVTEIEMRFGNEVPAGDLNVEFPKDAKEMNLDFSGIAGEAMKEIAKGIKP